MKVNLTDKVLEAFELIPVGTTYIFRGSLYMRIPDSKTCTLNELVNSVDLETGSFMAMSNKERLCIVDCEVNVI